MARDIPESDWKELKQLHVLALDRFCQRVLAEVAEISSDASKTAHQRYLALYAVVDTRNMEMSDIFDQHRRSAAIFEIAALQSRGLLEKEEFMRFSEETRALIEAMLKSSVS